MRIFLAGTSSYKNTILEAFDEGIVIPYLLESFYSINKWQIDYIKYTKAFILDSGAFSFLNKGITKDFTGYLRKYIDFINEYDVNLFFEMDIDAIVGIKRVEIYRHLIERETGKKPIIVFHRTRGKQYFLDMVQEYKYVALGGIALKDIKRDEHKYFNWFIQEAHKANCQIHGLGFTNTRDIQRYKFDSVDSTTWTSGGRFGRIFKLEGNKFKQYKDSAHRIKSKKTSLHNLKQWINFVNINDRGDFYVPH
jgi:hypothetical protein